MITLLLILLLALLICFVIKLKKRDISKRCNIAICVIIPFCILGIFVMFIFGGYVRRKIDIHTLNHLNVSMKLAMDGNKVFRTENEKIYYMNLLENQIEQINEIAENDSLISFCIGNNKEVSTRIIQSQKALKEQYIRCSRLNVILDSLYCYKQELYRPNLFKIIAQDRLGLSTINIAFRLKNNIDSIESVQIQMYNKEDTLFRQSYKYKSKTINCFTLPDVHSDYLLIKLGVIANVGGISTFVYTKYKANE